MERPVVFSVKIGRNIESAVVDNCDTQRFYFDVGFLSFFIRLFING